MSEINSSLPKSTAFQYISFEGTNGEASCTAAAALPATELLDLEQAAGKSKRQKTVKHNICFFIACEMIHLFTIFGNCNKLDFIKNN